LGVNDIPDILGKRKFFSDVAERTTVPGVATGLAWTPYGGDILFIEASVSRGSGKLHITGQLGEVMKESAMLAISYLRARYEELNIPEEAFKYWDSTSTYRRVRYRKTALRPVLHCFLPLLLFLRSEK
jgi:ATP-dependent Lon protease